MKCFTCNTNGYLASPQSNHTSTTTKNFNDNTRKRNENPIIEDISEPQSQENICFYKLIEYNKGI